MTNCTIFIETFLMSNADQINYMAYDRTRIHLSVCTVIYIMCCLKVVNTRPQTYHMGAL